MNAKQSQMFRLGFFLFSLFPSLALADTDPAEAKTPPPKMSEADKIELQAEKALDDQDLDIAIPLFTKAAEMNSLRAQLHLGQLQEQAQYYDDAAGWYLTAAMQGETEAMYNLGKLYLTGRAADGTGVEKDEGKALYWINRAAERRNASAQRVMANAYKAGLLGLKVDPDQAATWEAKAKRQEAIDQKRIQEKLDQYAAEKKKLAEEAAKKSEK